MSKTTATNLTEKRRNKRCSNNFQDVLCHVSDLVRGITPYTVTVSYCLLYMNQVQGDCYLYTRQIKLKKKKPLQTFIYKCKWNDCRRISNVNSVWGVTLYNLYLFIANLSLPAIQKWEQVDTHRHICRVMVSMLISNEEHHYIMGLIISRSKLSSSYQKITCSRLHHSLDSKLLIYYSMIIYAHNVFNQVCG